MRHVINEGWYENIDSASDEGLTALHCAASGNRANIIELLIQSGSSIDAQDNDGQTPLHYATMEGHVESTKILIELGAQNLPDGDGWTPRMYADDHGHDAVIDLLNDGSNQTDNLPSKDTSSLQETAPLDQTLTLTQQIARAMLQESIADLERLFANGWSLDASLSGSPDTRPLAFALKGEKFDLAQWLLENEADVQINCVDSIYFQDTLTVVEWASKWQPWTFLLPTIIQRFIEQDGEWWAWGAQLHHAADENNLDALEILLKHLEEHADKFS